LFTDSAGNDVRAHPTSAAAAVAADDTYLDDDNIEVIDLSQFPSPETFKN